MRDISCPIPEQFEKLLADSLPDDEFTRVTEHLEHCQKCAKTVRLLESHDTIELSLRQGSGLLADDENGLVQELIDRISETPWIDDEGKRSHRLTACKPGSSPIGYSDGTEPDDAIARIIKLLEPARKAGELGYIGVFRIDRVIGVGGMGIVFAAEDTNLRRTVALKVMSLSAANKPLARERFFREAQSVAAIEDDNIVPVHQVASHGDLLYLVMPLLRGETLEARLDRDGPLPTGEALKVGWEIADGLHAAHEQGVIHRDIKPGNIWLESRALPAKKSVSDPEDALRNERTRILDFGLARPLDDGTLLTQTGGLAGTPSYMSPEQARGETLDARTDLFSLGCVIYECLTGEIPFHGPNVMASLLALALRNPKPIEDFRSDVPTGISEYVMSLLNKNGENRPESAREVAHRFRELEAEIAKGVDSSSQVRSSPKRTVDQPETEAVGNGAHPTRNSLWIKSLVALSILLGIIAIGDYTLRVETTEGTVVLQFNGEDPEGAIIEIDEQQKIIVGPKDSKDAVTIQADPGTHLLRVTKAEFEIFTKEFQMNSGDRRTIQVRLERSEAAAILASQDGPNDPTRRAISWVHAAGGNVYGYAGDEPLEFQPPHLAVTDPLSIYRIIFDFGNVQYDQISDNHLANLRDTKSLEMLRFRPAAGNLTDAGVRHLVTLKGLRGLSLAGQRGITDRGANDLAQMEQLEHLDLRASGITDAALPNLAQLNRLRTIDIRETVVSRDAVDRFQAMLPDCVVISDHAPKVIYSHEGQTQGRQLKLRKTLDAAPLGVMAASHDGNWMASASGFSPSTLQFTRVTDSRVQHQVIEEQGYAAFIEFSPDDRYVSAYMSTGRVIVLALDGFRQLPSFRLNTELMVGMAFDKSNLLWFAEPFAVNSVSIYDVETSKSTRLPATNIHRIGFSSNGESVALHRWGVGEIEIWDMATRQVRKSVRIRPDETRVSHSGGFSGVALSSTGKYLAAAGEDGAVRLWDVERQTEPQKLLAHVFFVYRVCFSPDDTLLASAGCDNTVRIWEVESGKLLASLVAHKHIVTSISFSNDGERLFSGSADGTMRIWEIH